MKNDFLTKGLMGQGVCMTALVTDHSTQKHLNHFP